MNISLTQMLAAVLMVGAAFVLVFAYRNYQTANSERRMRAMLTSAGLDPAIASIDGIDSTMTAIRKRCATCASEDLCERWLRGEVQGDNDFCPNAKAFETLRKSASPWRS